jgi:hypothetical protein
MVRPEGFEPPAYWFVASCSIQLSYGRTLQGCNTTRIPELPRQSNPANHRPRNRRETLHRTAETAPQLAAASTTGAAVIGSVSTTSSPARRSNW